MPNRTIVSPRPIAKIQLPEPRVFQSDTPPLMASLVELIKTSRTPNMFHCIVTPDFARVLIAMQSPNQRRQYDRTLQQLISDYRAGEFLFTGDSIRFQVGGLGIDGQHRLIAQVEANVTVQHLITVGLSEQAVQKIDAGRPRTVSDMLRLRGDQRIVPTQVMVAAINLEAKNFDSKAANGISRTEKIAAADQLSDLEMAFLGQMSAALNDGTIRTTGALAGALRAFRLYQEPMVAEFLAATFANEPASPSYIPQLSGELYNYLNKAKSAKGSSQEAVHNQSVAVVKTVRALVEGGGLQLKTATTREINQLSR